MACEHLCPRGADCHRPGRLRGGFAWNPGSPSLAPGTLACRREGLVRGRPAPSGTRVEVRIKGVLRVRLTGHTLSASRAEPPRALYRDGGRRFVDVTATRMRPGPRGTADSHRPSPVALPRREGELMPSFRASSSTVRRYGPGHGKRVRTKSPPRSVDGSTETCYFRFRVPRRVHFWPTTANSYPSNTA